MMRHIFVLLSVLLIAHGLLSAQTIYNLDTYTALASKPGKAKSSLSEPQTIEALIATIEGVLIENGEVVNIAKERNVPCKKIDADIPTFLNLIGTPQGKQKAITLCQEAPLLRFSFFSEQDLELAKGIDFGIVNQFAGLKYLVLYVDPSVYGQQPAAEQQVRIEAALQSLLGTSLASSTLKIFYRIPHGE